jgi:hypothetical protein
VALKLKPRHLPFFGDPSPQAAEPLKLLPRGVESLSGLSIKPAPAAEEIRRPRLG